MRRLIGSRLRNAGLARIETERSANQLHRDHPDGQTRRCSSSASGRLVDALRDELERISGKKVRVTIHEIKTPELDATLVAENVASQLEKRIAFRRALKQAHAEHAGRRKGREDPGERQARRSEMSRREWDRDGRVPLHTLARTSITARPKPAPRSVGSACSAGSTLATTSPRPVSRSLPVRTGAEDRGLEDRVPVARRVSPKRLSRAEVAVTR